MADFDIMNLNMLLLKGIYSFGFEKPSEIQKKAIPVLIKGGDVIAQAQSGTGKTGAFCIGLLQKIDNTLEECQGLILSPTRELAEQTYEVVTSISKFMEINIHLSVGGYSVVNEKANTLRWPKGPAKYNLADYFTKAHPVYHVKALRKYFVED